MNNSDIIPGRRYRGCNGATFAVERVEDGKVFYRVHRNGTRTSIELDAFAPLMVHELAPKESGMDVT